MAGVIVNRRRSAKNKRYVIVIIIVYVKLGMSGLVTAVFFVRKYRLINIQLRSERDAFTDLTDIKFISMFRLTKAICRTFIDEIKPFLAQRTRLTGIRPETRILCALRFFATGKFTNTYKIN